MKFKSFINWNKMMIVFGSSFVVLLVVVLLTRKMEISMFGTMISLSLFIVIDYFLLFSIYVLLFDDFYKLDKEGMEVYRYVFAKKNINYADIKEVRIEEKWIFLKKVKKEIVVLDYIDEKGLEKTIKLSPEHIKMFVGVIKEEVEKK